VTAATLGLVLAAEGPEPGLMARPPRARGKPLVGKHIALRSLYVGALLIGAMLAQQAITRNAGGSARAGHTVAMNTLVVGQALYCVACRSFRKSALSISAVLENPWLTAMVILNAALQALITYAPGIQDVWETEGMSGAEWGRTLAFAIAVFLAVEAEKAAGDVWERRPRLRAALESIASVFNGCSRTAPLDAEVDDAVVDAVAVPRSKMGATPGRARSPSTGGGGTPGAGGAPGGGAGLSLRTPAALPPRTPLRFETASFREPGAGAATPYALEYAPADSARATPRAWSGTAGSGAGALAAPAAAPTPAGSSASAPSDVMLRVESEPAV
jgi:hypothetical protein